MSLAIVVVTVAQLLDLGTFLRMIATRGPGIEANPIVSSMLADHGLSFVTAAKVAALSLTVAAIVVLGGRAGGPGHQRLAAAIVIAAVAAGLVGGLTNAVAILGGTV
jgi:hypothetical protein